MELAGEKWGAGNRYEKLSVMVLAAFIAAGVAVMPAQAKEGKLRRESMWTI